MSHMGEQFAKGLCTACARGCSRSKLLLTAAAVSPSPQSLLFRLVEAAQNPGEGGLGHCSLHRSALCGL